MSRLSPNNSKSDQQEHTRLTEELQFLGQMLSTETALFHQQAAAKHGMSITDSKTVSVLMQEGPMTAGELAVRLSLTTGAVTSVIDRLEAAKIVHRVSDKDDRRKVIVQLNHKGLAAMGKTYDSIGETFQRALQGYSAEQLRFLADYYKVAIELTKQEIQKLAAKK